LLFPGAADSKFVGVGFGTLPLIELWFNKSVLAVFAAVENIHFFSLRIGKKTRKSCPPLVLLRYGFPYTR
jgi:hypothetical protein